MNDTINLSTTKEKRMSEKKSFRMATGYRKKISQQRGVTAVVSTCVVLLFCM
jgi:hypothetical protein